MNNCGCKNTVHDEGCHARPRRIVQSITPDPHADCVPRAEFEAIGKFLPGFVEAMDKLSYIQRITEEYRAEKHKAREAAAKTRREIVERLRTLATMNDRFCAAAIRVAADAIEREAGK